MRLIYITIWVALWGQLNAADWTRMGWIQNSTATPPRPKSNPISPAQAQDPYRNVAGQIVFVPKADGWVHCNGKVLQVHPDGIRIMGSYGNSFSEREYFISGFPHQVAEGDHLHLRSIWAIEDGFKSYTTVLGSSRKIHKLTYGIPCAPPAPPPLTDEQKTAIAGHAEKVKASAQAAAIKYNLDLAEKGDPYGLFRMGQRYATGDGVEKNLTLAKEYLFKASAAGHQEAATLAKSLPQ